MIRVLLVDDQPVVRQGLRMLLTLEPDIEIVGEAQGGEEAIIMTQMLHPDVVVMDIEMPGMDGLAAMRALRARAADSALVALSIHTDRWTRDHAGAAGAVAFVEKRGEVESLLRAIRHAVLGRPPAASTSS